MIRNRLLHILTILSVLASFSRVADAGPATITGALDGSYTTYNRASDRTGYPDSANDALPYEVLQISAPSGGTLTATIGNTTQFDSFLTLYSSFDPATPLANILAADDDSGGYPHALLTKSGLAANTIYYLVVTSYAADGADAVYPLFGSYNLTLGGGFALVPYGTTTGISATPNPAAYNQQITLSTTVTKLSGMAPVTGSVTFMDGAVTLGTVAVNAGGQASLTVSPLVPASHSITALYSGETKYAASASAPLIVTVNPRLYTVTTSSGAGGSIAPSGAVPVAEGTSASFTIMPNTGYRLVLPIGGSCGGLFTGDVSGGSYAISPIGADCTVTASFMPGNGAAARHDVTITSGSSSGGSWSGTSPAVWMPNGSGATVSASEIQSRLESGSDVIISTNFGAGAENGDIIVNSPLPWTKGNLTLDAAHDITIGDVMSAGGTTATLSMNHAVTVTGGTLKTLFAPGQGNGFSGRVDFNRSGTGLLTINGLGYTVITSLGAEGSTTGTDLQGINGNLSGNFALGGTIDASDTLSWNGGAGFKPLGDVSIAFNGSFDGLGHSIANLYLYQPDSYYIGLFGYAAYATLRNLGLNDLSVEGALGVGGLFGVSYSSSIARCYASGTVNGSGYIGGLVGYSDYDSISSSYTTTAASGTSDFTGGLVGYNITTGIAGSFATGQVSGNNSTGGLVGLNINGSIANSYATGKVMDSGANSGGLVGYNDGGTIATGYATGKVTGATSPGALVGNNTGSITSSFWNTIVNSLLSGVGTGDGSGATGKSSAELRQLGTFSGWDIDSAGGSGTAWRIYEGHSYPLLRSFLAPLAVTAHDAAKTYDGTPYSGGNGISFAPAGYDATEVHGTPTYGGSSQGATAVGSFSIIPGGLYSGQQGYDISYVNGTLTISPLATAKLSVTIGGDGSVHGTSTPHGQNYSCGGGSCPATPFAIGDQVTLSATQSAYSTFSGWGGACTSISGDCSVFMDGDKTVTATFAANPALVKIESDLTPYYSISAALAAAPAPVSPKTVTEVQAQASPVFDEMVTKTNPVEVLLKGGYSDAAFTSQTGYSTINGWLRIRGGKLIVQRLKIR